MQQGAFAGGGGGGGGGGTCSRGRSAGGEVQQGRCSREVQQRTCKGGATEDVQHGRCSRGGATEEVQQRTCSRGRAAGKEEEEEGHARVNHKTTHRGSGNNMLLEDRAPLAIKCRWLR